MKKILIGVIIIIVVALLVFEYEKKTVKNQNYYKIYQKQCRQGNLVGCYHLAFLYSRGKGGLAQDKSKAKHLFYRACDGGVRESCKHYKILRDAGY